MAFVRFTSAPEGTLGAREAGVLPLVTPPRLLNTPESLAALVGFSLFGVLFYAPILFHARVYTFRDLYPLFLGMDHLARVFGAWHWPPLWNPLEVLGRPFAADLEAGIFYPPNWFFRRLPEPFGFNVSMWFHHVVAAWGAFLLLRDRGLRAVAAVLGGAMFGFGGGLVALDNLVNGLQSVAWWPWVVLASDRWCDRQNGPSLVLVVLMIALTILGAMPEFVALGAILMFALACDRHWSRRGPRPARSLAGLALALILALGLCAVAVVPFAEYVISSTRRVGLEVNEVLKHSLEPLGLLSFVLPRRFLLPDGSLHVSAGLWERALSRVPWMLTLYAGPGVAFLAYATAPLTRLQRRWWAGIVIAFVLLALGDHIPGVRYAVECLPILRLVRYPEKFMLGVHALLAVGAAIGFEWSMQRPERLHTVAGVAGGLAVIMAVGAAAVSWWGQPLASPLMQSDLIRQAALFVLVAILARLGEYQLGLATLLLLICVLADLYRVNAGLLPSTNWDEVTAVPEALTVMERSREPLRIFSDEGGRPRVARYPDMFFQYRDLLLVQSASMYLVANLNTPAPLNLGDSDRLQALIRTASADRLSTIMAFFNVAYLTSPQALEYPGLVLVREPHAPLQPFVYEITNVTPRSFVPRRILPVWSAEQALNHLRTSEDPATEVAVPAQAIPPGLPAAQLGRVRLAAYLPDQVELQAEMESPGLVVLSDAFYPGWKAEVNGTAATIVRVNEFVRGVFVGAGSQRIIFEYNPPAYRLGLAITGAFAVGLAGLMCWQILPHSLTHSRK